MADYQQGVKRTGTNDLDRNQSVKQKKKKKRTTHVARSTNSTMDDNDYVTDGTADSFVPIGNNVSSGTTRTSQGTITTAVVVEEEEIVVSVLFKEEETLRVTSKDTVMLSTNRTTDF